MVFSYRFVLTILICNHRSIYGNSDGFPGIPAILALAMATKMGRTSASNNNNNILPIPVVVVTPVTTHQDIVDLANLRFDEWIHDDTVSRSSFAMATADMVQERSAGGAIAFLAKLSGTPVGAAELSPLEFANTSLSNNALYVTDVVTSKEYRRLGVASALMTALETTAKTLGVAELFLHIEPNNTAALHFYQSPQIGYRIPQQLKGLDTKHLAENAGTVGQLLLSKVLTEGSHASPTRNTVLSSDDGKLSRNTGMAGGGTGFGSSVKFNLKLKQGKNRK